MDTDKSEDREPDDRRYRELARILRETEREAGSVRGFSLHLFCQYPGVRAGKLFKPEYELLLRGGGLWRHTALAAHAFRDDRLHHALHAVIFGETGRGFELAGVRLGKRDGGEKHDHFA